MALKKRPKKLEKEYIRLTPSIILLFNAISGIITLCNNYSYYYIIASLAGCSFIFLPQFLINKRRYDLCIYYLISVITVFLNMSLSMVYYFLQYNSRTYLIQVITLNSIGVIIFLIGRFKCIELFKKKI